MFGYQYSEILRSLMCVYLCGGSCIEDVTTHLLKHLSLPPTLRTCSADTILRAIEQLHELIDARQRFAHGHLMKHLSLHPTLRTCSADTILRAIEELTCKNITYKSASGNSRYSTR